MTEAKEKGDRKKTGGLGKVILDTSCLQASGGGGGGGCPVEKVLYVIFLATGILYAAHVADRDKFREVTSSVSLGLLSDLFQFIDKYSPFNEMFETDEELVAKLRGQSDQSDQSERGSEAV